MRDVWIVATLAHINPNCECSRLAKAVSGSPLTYHFFTKTSARLRFIHDVSTEGNKVFAAIAFAIPSYLSLAAAHFIRSAILNQ